MLICPKALVNHLKLIKMCIYCKTILDVTLVSELLTQMFSFYPQIQAVVLHKKEVMTRSGHPADLCAILYPHRTNLTWGKELLVVLVKSIVEWMRVCGCQRF